MTTIYLIRHAEAEGNLYRRIHGWYNALITDNGFAQIKALEKRFQDIQIDAVWSSDLYRTMTTARAVYIPKNLPLNTDPGLREINLGDWEDVTWGQARHDFLEELTRFDTDDPTWQAPNGEGFRQLGDRLEGTVRRIAAQYPDQTIALFSHGMAIRQLLSRIKGLPEADWPSVPHGDNTAVTKLAFDGERYQADNAGYIPFCYIVPQRRGYGLGVQLIGQAVAIFRPMGRDKLRLRCAPYNQRAQRFYQKYGFVKIGEEENSAVPLDILEKYTGYDR